MSAVQRRGEGASGSSAAAWLDGWARIPAWAIVDPRLTDGERVTLAYVVARIFGDAFSLSQREIMRHRGAGERTVREHLRRLCETGYLRVEHRPGRPATYGRGEALNARPGNVDPGGLLPGLPSVPRQPVAGDPGSQLPVPRQPVAGDPGNQLPGSADEEQTKRSDEEQTTRARAPEPPAPDACGTASGAGRPEGEPMGGLEGVTARAPEVTPGRPHGGTAQEPGPTETFGFRLETPAEDSAPAVNLAARRRPSRRSKTAADRALADPAVRQVLEHHERVWSTRLQRASKATRKVAVEIERRLRGEDGRAYTVAELCQGIDRMREGRVWFAESMHRQSKARELIYVVGLQGNGVPRLEALLADEQPRRAGGPKAPAEPDNFDEWEPPTRRSTCSRVTFNVHPSTTPTSS